MFRFLNRMYAGAMGYFWLPCPVCGEHFGGHEISRVMTAGLVVQEADGQHAYCVCTKPECSEEAMRRNAQNGYAQAMPTDASPELIAALQSLFPAAPTSQP